MPVVSSGYVVGVPQADGRRYITEIHRDHLGGAHVCEYLADDTMNYDAILNARAVQLSNDLAESEANALLS